MTIPTGLTMTGGQTQLFPAPAETLSYHAALYDFEKDLLLQALRCCKGNVSEAARKIGLPRRSFYHRLRILGLDASALRAK